MSPPRGARGEGDSSLACDDLFEVSNGADAFKEFFARVDIVDALTGSFGEGDFNLAFELNFLGDGEQILEGIFGDVDFSRTLLVRLVSGRSGDCSLEGSLGDGDFILLDADGFVLLGDFGDGERIACGERRHATSRPIGEPFLGFSTAFIRRRGGGGGGGSTCEELLIDLLRRLPFRRAGGGGGSTSELMGVGDRLRT